LRSVRWCARFDGVSDKFIISYRPAGSAPGLRVVGPVADLAPWMTKGHLWEKGIYGSNIGCFERSSQVIYGGNGPAEPGGSFFEVTYGRRRRLRRSTGDPRFSKSSMAKRTSMGRTRDKNDNPSVSCS
jgi:hypothetical protein